MEITRQAGALGAIVTGVDLATVDDATYKELRARRARAPGDLRPRAGPRHPR